MEDNTNMDILKESFDLLVRSIDPVPINFDNYLKKQEPCLKSKSVTTFTRMINGVEQMLHIIDNTNPIPIEEKIMRETFIKYLGCIKPSELQDRISEFRKLDIKNMDDRRITQELYNTFTVNGNFIIHRKGKTYRKGTKIYRVRKLDNCDMPNNKLTCQQDYWNPPAECITEYGRINKPGVSVLYASLAGMISALEEANISPTDNFALIFYEAKEDIRILSIGERCDYKLMFITDENLILVDKMINDFIKDEFSREVGAGTEHLYKVSGLIAEIFYSLPESHLDAWEYPSVKAKTNINLCFRPNNARKKLALKGVAVCEGYNDKAVYPKYFAREINEKEIPIYHKWDKKTLDEIMRQIKSKNSFAK